MGLHRLNRNTKAANPARDAGDAAARFFITNALGFRARNNASVAVDDRKRHGILSALEVQRIIGAVNINDLARTQASPNLLHSTVVVAVTRHDVDVAVAIDRPVEGDDVFIANRRHNGLIRPNRA
jgi:hypothetical protein